MVTFGTSVMVGPRRWADLARAAEEAGFESVWVPEHLICRVHDRRAEHPARGRAADLCVHSGVRPVGPDRHHGGANLYLAVRHQRLQHRLAPPVHYGALGHHH